MKAIFIAGEDIHRMTARDIIGIANPTAEDRKKAKAVNFGLIYRMGWKKLRIYARTKYGVELSPGEAKKIVKNYFLKYNRLRYYYEKQERVARMNGYVRHPLGRVRHLPNIFSEDEQEQNEAIRLAINSPVQGFASDYNLAGMVDVDLEFNPTWDGPLRIVGTVHDSGLMWVHALHLRRILPRVKEIMEHPPRVKNKIGFTPTVPWKVDFKIGPWGAGKEIDPMAWENWEVFVKDMKESGQWERYKQAREAKKIDSSFPSVG
jgi:DNA polymerase-1